MMLDLAQSAHAIGAKLVGPGGIVTGVTSDSRAITRGALFVALRGERFDGHAFVEAAFGEGAFAAMVDERGTSRLVDERGEPSPERAAVNLLVVDDTRRGLRALAAWWRSRFSIPVIGVVGSNGIAGSLELTGTKTIRHSSCSPEAAEPRSLTNRPSSAFQSPANAPPSTA